MKNSKLRRALLLLACAVMLVSLSVGATLALLTDTTNEVKNTFTVGSVGFDDDDEGEAAVGLDEAKVDDHGVPEEGADRVTSNIYKLIPNQTYTKDPTVHIDSESEDAWLFVQVKNGIADIEADVVEFTYTDTAGKTHTLSGNIADQMLTLGWTKLENYTDKDGNTVALDGVYYYNTKVSKNDQIPVFAAFKLAADADVSAYEDATITINAYLVQAEGLTSQTLAWEAAPLTAWHAPVSGT